ncbi:Error-prone DNA polymerase [uncultured archaeon]|nr:Error-prone DNA polymerase [uncultured archaeon]
MPESGGMILYPRECRTHILYYPGKSMHMRFDLHIHSNHSSDSNLAVDDILKRAVRNGLDGIAICDHNTVEGSLGAIRRAQEMNLPLLVLPGIEISTSDGHLIVLGVRENIPAGLPASETIMIARQKGGVAIAPHPFKKEGIGFAAKDADAIETFNSRCVFGENETAKNLAVSLGKPEVGGSDSHLLSTIGIGFTDIDARRTESAVLESIRKGKTVSGGRVIPLHIMMIHSARSLSRKIRRHAREFHSKIFLV